MNKHSFDRLVAEEVKNRAHAHQREYLRLPENRERWRDALIELVDNLDEQERSIDRQEDADTLRYEALGNDGLRLLAEASSQYDIRRKKIGRFKFHVEARLDEVCRMIALGIDESGSGDETLQLVGFLRKSIERHREMMNEYDIEPSAIDLALWKSLDGKWHYDEIGPEEIGA